MKVVDVKYLPIIKLQDKDVEKHPNTTYNNPQDDSTTPKIHTAVSSNDDAKETIGNTLDSIDEELV